MYTGLILTSGLLACLLSPVVESQSCDKGWFGKNCRFKCQCSGSQICGRAGECPQYGQCRTGYFGPSCQYHDMLETNGEDWNDKYLTDNDDTTCNNSPNMETIVVSLKDPLPFMWIRVVVKQNESLLDFSMELNNQESCVNQRSFLVRSNIMDITCDNNKALHKIVIQGPIIPRVCTIQISEGRNVALKQEVKQTHEVQLSGSSPSNAVDDNTDSIFEHGSCTLSASQDVSPHWSLQFSKPHVIFRAKIFNRNKMQDRLNGFKFETFNYKGNKTNLFLNSDENDSILTYDVALNSWEPIVDVKITAGSFYLTLCEVQVFGDVVCPEDYYGLECERECNCTPGQVCSPVLGLCAPGCPKGTYGFNCSLVCPPNCYLRQCTARDGLCSNCLPGFMGEVCDQPCPKGTYGHECNKQCSVHCAEVCNTQNGACKCKPQYSGLNCSDKVCPAGMYGNECSQNCSDFCHQRQCKADNGECVKCRGFREGKFCEGCPAKSFGESCQFACSEFCFNQTCDEDTGNCSSCTNGYTGVQCSLSPEAVLNPYWLTVTPVPILLVACLLFTFLCKRKRGYSSAVEDEG